MKEPYWGDRINFVLTEPKSSDFPRWYMNDQNERIIPRLTSKMIGEKKIILFKRVMRQEKRRDVNYLFKRFFALSQSLTLFSEDGFKNNRTKRRGFHTCEIPDILSYWTPVSKTEVTLNEIYRSTLRKNLLEFPMMTAYTLIKGSKAIYEQSRELMPKGNIPSKLCSQDVTICTKCRFLIWFMSDQARKLAISVYITPVKFTC